MSECTDIFMEMGSKVFSSSNLSSYLHKPMGLYLVPILIVAKGYFIYKPRAKFRRSLVGVTLVILFLERPAQTGKVAYH